MKHIAVITGNYPSNAHPNRGTFVHQLVHAFAEQQVRCAVIHPWKAHEWITERRGEVREAGMSAQGVRIERPVTFSFSNHRVGSLNTFALTHGDFKRAVWRSLRRLPEAPDVVYGHFLYSGGAAAVWAARRMGLPGFVAVGESIIPQEGQFWTLNHVRREAARRLFADATGFVAVSDLVRRQLMSELAIPEKKIAVFPNGIDRQRFHPRNREAMRQKYGLPQHRFLVAFVGGFNERKGMDRVDAAIQSLPGVGGIFIGDGPLRPSGDHVVFCGRVPHREVPEFLCAADVFVLPSRAEGCSNAILEALACGLPVVASARPFNEIICDTETARLVDPESIAEIREAILSLKNDPALRQHLARAALLRAGNFDIRTRARRILVWMEERIQAGANLRHVEREDAALVAARTS